MVPCGWACSTSAPTPGTCWWSTPTTAPPRCRRSPTSSRCGSPSTSTERARVTQSGIDALTVVHRGGARGRRGEGLRGRCWPSRPRRSATPVNSDAVLAHVRERTGVAIEVLSGEDEARLTFLAVRRWFGWSAGRLAVFDIGGGSLEIAAGADERPDVAWSLPLGAARLARDVLRRPPVRRGRASSRSARSDPGRHRPRCRPAAAHRYAAPRRRDLEDLPLAGPDLRRRAVDRRPAGAALAARWPTCASGSPSWSR